MAKIIMTIYLIKYSMYFCSALYKQFITVHLLNIYKYTLLKPAEAEH